jgi:hypothetical protein
MLLPVMVQFSVEAEDNIVVLHMLLQPVEFVMVSE